MFIFQLRCKGQPLDPREAVRSPTQGWLSFRQGSREFYPRGVMVARVVDPNDRNRDLVPAIDNAKVELVEGHLRIRGIEYFKKTIKSRTDRWEQAWLCCHTKEEGEELMRHFYAKGTHRWTPCYVRSVTPKSAVPMFIDDDPGDPIFPS
jgi:hypothetical protein